MVDIMQILVSVLLYVAVAMSIYSLFRFPVPAEPPVHRRLALAMGAEHRQTIFENPVLSPVMHLALTMSHRFGYSPIRRRIRQDLDASGNPQGYSVEEYLAICLVCGIGLALATAIIELFLINFLEPTSILLMGVLGFYGPLWTVGDAARSRLGKISKKIPYTLDLIALTMASGSTFTEAIDTMIRDEPDDDFNQELAIVRAEIDFGSPRAQAMQNLAERIPLDSLRSVIGAVIQAEALGTPLAEILKNQSGMLRMHRSVRAEKLSASASLRILIPSMLILGAVVLVIFGPLVLRMISGELTFR